MLDKNDRIVLSACALAVTAFLTLEAKATEVHIQLHGLSHHTSERTNGKPWNEKNDGGGIRAQFNPHWGVQAGTYSNSMGRVSKYAFVQYTPLAFGPVQVGAFGGYVSGYRRAVPAGAGAMATWQSSGRLSATVRYVPPVGNSSGVWALELGLKL